MARVFNQNLGKIYIYIVFVCVCVYWVVVKTFLTIDCDQESFKNVVLGSRKLVSLRLIFGAEAL